MVCGNLLIAIVAIKGAHCHRLAMAAGRQGLGYTERVMTV